MTEGIIPEQALYVFHPVFTSKEVNYLYPQANCATIDTFLSGTLSFSYNTYTTYSYNGKRVYSYQDIIYNNVWVLPVKLDLGFIVRDLTFEVYLWNSYFTENRTLNETEFYGQLSGCELFLGTLPLEFTPTQEKQGVLDVYVKGDSNIDGYIKFIFDIVDIDLTITGKRVIPVNFVFDCPRMSISYIIKNIKSATQKFKENRRTIVDIVKRRLKFTLEIFDKKLRGILDNIIRFGQDKTLGIPILIEQMQPTGVDNLQGFTTITVEEDISKMFNLQRADFVGIYNRKTKEFEIVEIESLETPHTINLETAIIGDFPTSITKVYPVILCYLEQFEDSFNSLQLVKYNISFREV